MNASIVDLFTWRSTTRKESAEDIARRQVMAGCIKHGVPLASARIQANAAAAAVRNGFEPSGAVRRAIDRAVQSSFPKPDGPDAA